MKDKQLPDVRFGIHKDGWKRIKAKEIFISISDKNHPTLPVLSASQERGMVFRDQIGIDIKYEKDSVKGYKRVKPGQFVIHLRSFQGGFAYSSVEGITSPAYTIIDFKNPEEHDDLFWKIIFSSRNFIKSLEAVTYGIRDGRSISFNDFGTLSMHVPSREEQTKIGSFFKSLDDTISLHQQELEALKQTKQGFLQKMFPKNEDAVPEIRLKGFTDEWTLCELKNVATFINGRAYKQNELLDSGKYKVLRVGNFYTNTSWYYSDLELGEKYYANFGDLLYTWSASFGPHIWKGDKVIYHYHIWRVDLKDGFDKHFIVQLFEYDKAKIMSDKNGSTMVHITKKGMEEKIVRIPSYDEQIKIGEFFKQLDEVIELKEKELEALKETKKGFLQKMFV